MAQSTPQTAKNTIVVGIDPANPEQCVDVLEHVASLRSSADTVVLAHLLLPRTAGTSVGMERREWVLEQLGAMARRRLVDAGFEAIRFDVRFDDPASGLCSVAQEHGALVVVIGTREGALVSPPKDVHSRLMGCADVSLQVAPRRERPAERVSLAPWRAAGTGA